MVDCYLSNEIFKGQYKKRKYTIWSIWKRESALVYWYVIMYNDTYSKTFNEQMNLSGGIEKIEDETTNKAIDIRKLPGYTELKPLQIIRNRKELVAPIIMNAIKNGVIEPL